MSIVRVGLAETKNFSEGYDLIFGKKDDAPKPDNAECCSQPQSCTTTQTSTASGDVKS